MNLMESLRRRMERRRTYESLRHLDDHLLRDIGVEMYRVGQMGAAHDSFARLQGRR